ncbi:MAG: phytanoyl-CoA dioxygenase family protein [Rhodospirillales bacterium]|jgi:ectoine hydroxylase
MTPEDIINHPPIILSQEERKRYFSEGYTSSPAITPPELLKKIQQMSADFLEKSRELEASNEFFDLGPNHSSQTPHVRRLRRPVDAHPFFWELATSEFLTGIAADLVGPDVKFHSAKLNYKWPGGGEIVKWHQDIPAWPHTNYSPVTIGIYLDDVTTKTGPLACVPGSHNGKIFSHYDLNENWTGSIRPDEENEAGVADAVNLTGPAGTVIAINCRTVHGSSSNLTDQTRPLLLFVYSSADAFPWTAAPTPTSKTGEIVRGISAKFPHIDPRPCPVPPDWARLGYGSIFTAQSKM